ncbi:MAG: 2-C-methyl-D-erythritol 4-phosphate cytidylyltransferase [Saccharofermentans sp.]|nr:2-C-methyl-D-erythritol 4-phosphate cytidylyltransferase [Saccharofermentans sp.]
MANNLVFIVPAAGAGTRMHSAVPKIMLPVEGKSVIVRTLEAIASFKTGLKVSVVLVTTPELKDELASVLNGFSTLNGAVVLGGDTRTVSVSNGVAAIPSIVPEIAPDDLVLIHDGARCLVTSGVIAGVVSGLSSSPVCVASVPVKDTLKITREESGKRIAESTPDRSLIYAVQTPQGFRYDTLVKCYSYALSNGITATDDTALAEMLGIEVAISTGSYSNIKITTPEDIALAKEILRSDIPSET